MARPEEYLPKTADDLLHVEPEDLAVDLLRFLDALEGRRGAGLLLYNLKLDGIGAPFEAYYGPQFEQVLARVTETWEIMEREGWLTAAESGGPNQQWKTLSGKGRAAIESASPTAFASSALLPRDMDPELATDVTSDFARGRLHDAVRNALRRVELRVRQLSGSGARGRRGLMVEAFRSEDTNRGKPCGALAHPAHDSAQQDSLRFFFEGAMGAWLNEHTHEDVAIESADEAAELIHAANLLLRIVRRNAQATGRIS